MRYYIQEWLWGSWVQITGEMGESKAARKLDQLRAAGRTVRLAKVR